MRNVLLAAALRPRARRAAWALAGTLALSAVGTALPAQEVRGVVLEEGTRTPVAGATVELTPGVAGNAQRAVTDSLGAFHIQCRRSGPFQLSVTHPSYAAISDTVHVGPEEALVLELTVGRVAIPLQPLVVKARARDRFGGFYGRSERGAWGHYLTREQLARRPGARVSELLRGMPGVQVVRAARGPGIYTNLVATRGGAFGQCLPLIYIDGMPIRQSPDNGVDDYLQPQLLEGVEVYTTPAGVPAQFQSLDACGVVAFWTRTDMPGRWSWWKLAAGAGGFLLAVLLARW